MSTSTDTTEAPAAAGKRKRGRPPKAKPTGPRQFIDGREIAHELGVTTGQLYDWVADQFFPPPWFQPGPKTRLWRRSHWDELIASGKWPREAWGLKR